MLSPVNSTQNTRSSSRGVFVSVFLAVAFALVMSPKGPVDAAQQCQDGKAASDASGYGVWIMNATTFTSYCSPYPNTEIVGWIHDKNWYCNSGTTVTGQGCKATGTGEGTGVQVGGLGYGWADGKAEHWSTRTGSRVQFGVSTAPLYSRSEDPEDPFEGQPCDYLIDYGPIYWPDERCPQSPIIIPTGTSQNIDLSSAENGVRFDIDGDGVKELIAWTESGRDVAFLAIDRDGDGVITSGKELFGNHTVAGASNGFAALAKMNMDTNGNVPRGSVNEVDPLFAKLLLWTDINHNGISEQSELRPAGDLFTDIGLSWNKHSRRDGHGNQFLFRGWVDVRTKPGRNEVQNQAEDKTRHRDVYDVFLRVIR